jgi:hypothetical protein
MKMNGLKRDEVQFNIKEDKKQAERLKELIQEGVE